MNQIYGYCLRPELWAPVTWVLAWAALLRAPTKRAWLKNAVMFPPLLAPLLATAPGATKTFLILSGLNVAGFGLLALLKRRQQLACHLIYASALVGLAGVPDHWLQQVAGGATRAQCVAAGLAAYLVCWTAWLRNPKLAVLGSMMLGLVILAALWHRPGAEHWALQGGLVFLLLHSLRWDDAEHPGAEAMRRLTGVAWAIQSFVWMNTEAGRFWMPLIPAAAVLGIYCAYLPFRGIWRLFTVPAAALVVMLSGPCVAMLDILRATPPGLLALSASFLLLGAGTVAALTREMWHKQ